MQYKPLTVNGFYGVIIFKLGRWPSETKKQKGKSNEKVPCNSGDLGRNCSGGHGRHGRDGNRDGQPHGVRRGRLSVCDYRHLLRRVSVGEARSLI